jgi:predicted nucleotidyltransferase
MPKVQFFKNHVPGCPKRRRSQSTSCDCRWQFRIDDGRGIDLSDWLGKEASPRDRNVLHHRWEIEWFAETKRFSPFGHRHSVDIKDLLEQPFRAHDVHPRDLRRILEQAKEHATRAVGLVDRLADRLPDQSFIAGRPMKVVRALVRLDEGTGFSLEDVASRIPDDAGAQRRLLADLVTDGWLVQDAPDHWSTTNKAKSLQTTSRGRLTRATADMALASFLERVDTVNASEQYAFKVKAVVLFGSYLSLQSRIGDVDLAIELRPRYQSKQQQEEIEKAARKRAKSLPTFLDELAWPEREVMRTLRGGSTALELRRTDELDALYARGRLGHYKVLVGWWQPKPLPAGTTAHAAKPAIRDTDLTDSSESGEREGTR